MDYTALSKKIPFRWRVQSYYPKDEPTTCQCVAYVDARDVMDLLDEVCGPDKWMSDYKEVKGHMYGGVGIKSDGGEWVWKWDCGSETDIEGEKGEASDAFKRAAVKWGVGRFLYEMGMQKLAARKHGRSGIPLDGNGNPIYNLTKWINGNKNFQQPAPEPPKESAPAKDGRAEVEKAWRQWRAYLNKSMGACKTSADIARAKADFEKRLGGPQVWAQYTFHDKTETFASHAENHEMRIKRDEDLESPEGIAIWLEAVKKSDLKGLAQRLQEYTDQDRLQIDECLEAMHERAMQLGLKSVDDLVEEPA